MIHPVPGRPRRSTLSGLLLAVWAATWTHLATGAPANFNVPAQPAAASLLAFSEQAGVEVLFSFDDLQGAEAAAVVGRYEADDALARLLQPTRLHARRTVDGKYLVTRRSVRPGIIRGRVVTPEGAGTDDVRILIPESSRVTTPNPRGEFELRDLAPGVYRLAINGAGWRPIEIVGARVEAGHVLNLETQTLQRAEELLRLAPQIVQGKFFRHWSDRGADDYEPQKAGGNLDLPRTADDALPFTIYDREQIARSGVVNLNEFLQRNILDSASTNLPPEQNGKLESFDVSSTNLQLRGFDSADETVVLVNGRRLPEVIIGGRQKTQQPDVNFIPLSLVDRIEVLPISASALYTGNPVGGIINIVLRPDANVTEVNATYTNAFAFDAAQTSLSFQHGETLLDGRLRIRFNATFTRSTAPNESELGYIQSNLSSRLAPPDRLYRATPNVRSADDSPLGTHASAFTSVAPGSNGREGLAAFSGRDGVASLALFESPGAYASTPDSLDYPYGRRQRGESYFGSATFDLTPWLQLGADGIYTRTIVNRGYNVFGGNLSLAADSPLNPFGEEALVTLNEFAPALGEDYGQANVDFYSLVLSALVKLPADWRVTLDGQYGHSLTRYRGLAEVDTPSWQRLVDAGVYNPLRDTQLYGPPPEFYDHALVYYGGRQRFVTLGDYETFDTAIRVTNPSITLPTGSGVLSVGGDFRLNRLASYRDERRFGDGSLFATPTLWAGRTIQRLSAFTELQAPLLPARWLPAGLQSVDVDLALRYTAADTAEETNLAPTGGLKIDLAGGFSLRGSVATANRVPSPFLSRKVIGPSGETGSGEVTSVIVHDPLLQQDYSVQASDALNANLRPESAVTRTAGIIFRRGEIHRWRTSVDFTDTEKSGELTYLNANQVVLLEPLFPARVTRQRDASGLMRITSLRTGTINLARRSSQSWNTSLDYSGTRCLGGRLDLYGRWVYFQRYEVEVTPSSGVVDQLDHPDGTSSAVLRHRMNFGAAWSNRDYGFGLDGHYFHSRQLPVKEWAAQQRRQINPHWQFDAFVQTELARWLPWGHRYGLRAQLRVNNLLNTRPPRYANDPSGAGVQPYGDWRGQTFALTLNATY